MRDWSALPGDLLCLVSDRLGLPDYVRFGAVCTHWRQSVSGRRSHPPLRPGEPPWLMSLSCRAHGTVGPTSAEIFCLADGRSHRLDLQDLPSRHTHRVFIGSASGWLVTADELSELHMLNPITGEQVQLPSILTLPCVEAIRDPDGRLTGYLWESCVELGLEETSQTVHERVALSHPSSSSDWTAVLVYQPGWRLAFARAGDTAWNLLAHKYSVDDVMYHKGLFYVVKSFHGATKAWDLTGPCPRPIPVGPLHLNDDIHMYKYLVESGGYIFKYLVQSGDDLLQVWKKRGYINGDGYLSTLGFDVFRLDEKEQEWVGGVKSLGGRALFLGLNCSMSLSALEYRGLKTNCIYFTQDGWEWISSYRNTDTDTDTEGDTDMEDTEEGNTDTEGALDMGVFNLEDGTIDRCFPRHDYTKSPPPIWFLPSPF